MTHFQSFLGALTRNPKRAGARLNPGHRDPSLATFSDHLRQDVGLPPSQRLYSTMLFWHLGG